MRILVAVLALVSAGSAQAYSWPLKPFNRQHPVGGNFGDPRMTFLLTLGQNGLEGPGAFGFHNGIDIFADAFDLPEPLPAFTLRLPVSPAEVSWTLRRAGGRVVRQGTPADFRGFSPPNSVFWRVYGRGTYPNGPVFGGRLYKKMP